MTSGDDERWEVDARITDADARAYLAALGRPVSRAGLTADEIRRRSRMPLRAEGDPYRLDVSDVVVDDPVAPLGARVYRPTAGSRATLLYLHGGGWALGDLDINDDVCRFLAHHAELTVLSLDYPLAPEHPFPAALDAATRVARQIAQGVTGHGLPTALHLGGLSAGGALAAALSARAVRGAAPAARSLTLLSPVTDSDISTESMIEFGEAPVLTRADMVWFWSLYDADGARRGDPDAAPLRATSFAGHPVTTVVVAGVDPLRDEAVAYASGLSAAGVDVESIVVPGVPHGFMAVPTIRSGRDALRLCAARIRSA